MATREQLEIAAKGCYDQLEQLILYRENTVSDGFDFKVLIDWGWIAQQKLEENAIIIDNMLEQFDNETDRCLEQPPETPVEFRRLQILYEHNYKWEDNPTQYFLEMVKSGNTDTVDLLLFNNYVYPDEYNNRAFRIAATKGYLNIVVRMLHDPRIDPSDKENGALTGAIVNGHRTIETLLLQDERVQRQEIIIKATQRQLEAEARLHVLRDVYLHKMDRL
jgi:hypothetical protein